MNINHEDGNKQENGSSSNDHDLSANVQKLISTNRILRAENDQLKEKFNELKDFAEDLQKENGLLKAEKSEMQEEISRLSENLKSKESQVEELVTVNASLFSAVDQMGIQNEKLSSAEEKLAMEKLDNLSSMTEEYQLNKKAMETMTSELSTARYLAQRAVMELEAERAAVASLKEEIEKLSKRSIFSLSALHYAAAAFTGAVATVGFLCLYKSLHRST